MKRNQDTSVKAGEWEGAGVGGGAGSRIPQGSICVFHLPVQQPTLSLQKVFALRLEGDIH